MKQILLFFCVIFFLNACKKNNDSIPTDPVPPVVLPTAPDTLSAGWTKVGSIPIEETISDVFFTDLSNGYITTSAGIYRSTDAGNNWTKINTDGGFVNIGAIGTNACFVNGTNNLYNTQNNGAIIQKMAYNYSDLSSNYSFQDCFYTNYNNCYLQSGRYFWKSINAGITFDTVYQFPSISGSGSACSMFFRNDQEGWIARDNKVFKTQDGGITWDNKKNLSNTFGPVFFNTADSGFVCDYNVIYKTVDAGDSWQSVSSLPYGITITDIYFFDTTTGYCCAGNKIYKTTDAGINWTTVVSLGEKTIVEIHFLDEHHGWACGQYGYVLRFNL